MRFPAGNYYEIVKNDVLIQQKGEKSFLSDQMAQGSIWKVVLLYVIQLVSELRRRVDVGRWRGGEKKK